MYYSLTITDNTSSINTYDDWYIVPTSRPSFSPPSFDIKTVSIPGRNGLLDVTTALTKFPTFGNRTGNFEFLIHPDSPLTWYETYQKVSNYLYKTSKDFGSDICGFGVYALKNYLTIQDWYASNWLDNYRNSTFNVNVHLTVKSGNLFDKT